MDPVDELIMNEALDVARGRGLDPLRVAVLDAPGIAAAAAQAFAGTGHAGTEPAGTLAVHCDSLVDERTVPDELRVETDPAAALAGADLVLLRLPPALAALDEQCELIRAHADPGVRLVAGARIKHLRREMNEVLANHFGDVHASLGRRKSRVLHAAGLSDPRATPTYPRSSTDELDLPGGRRTIELVDHGATFARGRIDAGTRLLLSTAASWPVAADVIDLACGDGVLGVTAAIVQPDASVIAVDDSASACASAAATAAANGVRVEVERADGLTGRPDAWADLIVCNPPFHRGTTKDSTPAMTMLADSARVLRPGAELWTVFNAHLPYLPLLRGQVGSTGIVARNRSYVVTRTIAG